MEKEKEKASKCYFRNSFCPLSEEEQDADGETED